MLRHPIKEGCNFRWRTKTDQIPYNFNHGPYSVIANQTLLEFENHRVVLSTKVVRKLSYEHRLRSDSLGKQSTKHIIIIIYSTHHVFIIQRIKLLEI